MRTLKTPIDHGGGMGKKVTILDGSERGDTELAHVRDCLLGELASAGGEAQTLDLREMDLAYCCGCFGCWVKTPGACVVRDSSAEVAKAIIESEATLYLTRVTFGGYSSRLKRAVDRIICLGSPFFRKVDGEVHHEKRYDKYPNLIGVGLLPEPDEEAEAIFTALVGRNAINIGSVHYATAVLNARMTPEEMRGSLRGALTQAGVSP
jgi:multimeric flavodoxin WrbA